MPKCKKHDWKNHPQNVSKAICEVCGKTQYKVRLTKGVQKTLIRQMAEQKALSAINLVASDLGVTPESVKDLEVIVETPEGDEARKLVSGIVDDEEPPKLELEASDVLIWVGKEHYSPESFIKEARKMGVCRRVPFAPLGIIPDVSFVFLAHRDAIKTVEGLEPGIFACYTVSNMMFVVKPGTEVDDELAVRGISTYEYKEGGFGFNDERGCGSLKIGGVYLLGESDMNAVRDLAQSSSLAGHIEVFDVPIPLSAKYFRGYRYVDGSGILDGHPEEEWLKNGYDKSRRNDTAMWKWRNKVRKLKEE